MKRVCDRCLHALEAHQRKCDACGWVDPFRDKQRRDQTKSNPVKMNRRRPTTTLEKVGKLPKTPLIWLATGIVGAVAGSLVVGLQSPAEVQASAPTDAEPTPTVEPAPTPAPEVVEPIEIETRTAKPEDRRYPRRPVTFLPRPAVEREGAVKKRPKRKRKRRRRRR